MKSQKKNISRKNKNKKTNKKINKKTNKKINKKTNKNVKKIKIYKGGGIPSDKLQYCDFLQKSLDNYDSSNKYMDLIPFGNTSLKDVLVKSFPSEECKKLTTPEECNKYANCQTNESNICSFQTGVKTNLSKFADKIEQQAKINPKNLKDLYGYFQRNVIRELFKISSFKIYISAANNNSAKKNIMTWYDFKELIAQQNKSCNYNYFRKLTVDALIIMIIIYLFNTPESEKPNISIYKAEQMIFQSNSQTKPSIKIIYQMVGAEDVTSDYDVTIFSIPPNKMIAEITTIFSHAFTFELHEPSSVIFDTNLYSHPVYFFSQSQISKNKNDALFIDLNDNNNGVYKYFINSGNEQFYDNEILFSNLLYMEITDKYLLSALLSENVFMQNPLFSVNGNIELATLFNSNFDNFGELKLDKNIPSGNLGIENKSLCLTNTIKLTDKRCKAGLESFASVRLESDTKATKVVSDIYNDITNINNIDSKTIITQYISPMRKSLWYADETYHTFSAYFHVIHCCATPHDNISTINHLLNNMKTSFKNICRVSALENFAFMFHYYTTNIGTFIKKIAKYLARVSHACALLQLLNSNSNYTLSTTNLSEFRNFGLHTYITDKYKNNKPVNYYNSSYQGIFTQLFENVFKNYTNSRPLDILKQIYNSIVSNEFGITEAMICIKP